MRVLVTGSAGHLGEALARTLKDEGHQVTGLDVKPSAFTTHVGSICDPAAVKQATAGASVVYHPATLHKPHIATHAKQRFVDVNTGGTLTLLTAAVEEGVEAFVFTSTTSLYGHALRPPPDEPAVWVTEKLEPVPRNIYGVTKRAAEDLCRLFHEQHGLNCLILRTSRFFPEEDDAAKVRREFEDGNVKANEYLYRRVEIEDVVTAHRCAADRAAVLRFGTYIVSATTPFAPQDAARLRVDAPSVLRERVPEYLELYEQRGWRMFNGIDRVYDNSAARRDLGWRPRYDFNYVLSRLSRSDDARSTLARRIGSKGYHDRKYADGPYPVDGD